jgi:hypothetical protein
MRRELRITVFGDVAQLGERLLCKQEVAGSTPVISINILFFDNCIAE